MMARSGGISTQARVSTLRDHVLFSSRFPPAMTSSAQSHQLVLR